MSKPTDISKACKAFGLDGERGLDALRVLIRDERMYLETDKAVAIILERIKIHGYPEPLIVPELERCCNCYRPVDDHLPQCGLSSDLAPVPDVPRWMGKALTKRERTKAKVQARLRENRAQREQFVETLDEVVATANVGREEMQRFRDAAAALPVESSWDNPPPCTCESTWLISYASFQHIECQNCRRAIWGPEVDDKAQRDTSRALALQAWTEGRGKAGEVYYVESEPRGESTCTECACSGPKADDRKCPDQDCYCNCCVECWECCSQPVESEPAEPVVTSSAGVGCITVDIGTGKSYVNGEEVTPIQASPWPCKCGAGVPESREVTLNTRGHRWWVECRSKTCPNYASGENQTSATGLWNELSGVQPKGKTLNRDWTESELDEAIEHIASKASPGPTWDNPGPCVCGVDAQARWVCTDGRCILTCNPHADGCGQSVEGSTKAFALAAWVNRKADSHE